MESKSEESLKRITDLLWKIWWFSLYLLIIPSIALLISYLITSYIFQDYLYSVFFSIIFFVFCQIFFYQMYDKYREEPYLKNHRNNLQSRIILSFLFPFLSLGLSIIPVWISPIDLKYQLLPFLYYIIINLNMFFYLYAKPIEGFDSESKDFFNRYVRKKPELTPKVKFCSKCGQPLKETHYYCPNCGHKIFREELESKQTADDDNTLKERKYRGINFLKPHNFIIFLIYISSFIYLLLTFMISGVSTLMLLLAYGFFFFYVIHRTRQQRAFFQKDPTKIDKIEESLLLFQKKFVLLKESLLFCLLFIISTIFSVLIYLGSTNLVTASTIIILSITITFILFFSYVKVRLISVLYYAKKYEARELKYKKYNGFLSISIILLIFILVFLIQQSFINIFGVVLILLLFFVSYLEQKKEYISKTFISFLYLTLTCVIIGLISFSVIPLFWKDFLLNFQIITFLILFYLASEIFKYFNLFARERILITQNFISVVLFFLISYSIYPFFFFIGDIILNIYIGFLIFFLSLLLSFYRLYSRFFKETARELFSKVILANFAMLNLFVILIMDYFLIFCFNTLPIIILIILLSSLLFFALLMGFIGLNGRFSILEKEYQYYYFILWMGIPLIFTILLYISFLSTLLLSLSIFALFIFLSLLLGDIILLCFALQFQVKFGLRLEKIELDNYTKLLKFNAFIISFASAGIIFLLLSLIPSPDYFIILFLSILVLSIMLNLSSISEFVSASKSRLLVNTLFLTYLSIFVSYFLLIFAQDTFYFIHAPLIAFCCLMNLLLFYWRKMEFVEQLVRILLWLNNLLLCGLLVSLPYLGAFELISLGVTVDFLTIFNLSIYILFFEIVVIYFIVRAINPTSRLLAPLTQSEVIIVVVLTGTTIFYYSFILISGIFLGFLIPLIISSCFFYIPIAFSHQKKLFNSKLIELLILVNTIFLCACILVIPTFIALELINLGLTVSILYVIIPSLFILILFGKIFIYLAQKITIPTFLYSFFRFGLILIWFLISLFISYLIYDELSIIIGFAFNLISWNLFLIPLSILVFFIINFYNIYLIQNLKDYCREELKREQLSVKLDTFLISYQYFTFYGMIGSLSLILSFNIIHFNLIVFLPHSLAILNYLLFIALFLGLFNPLLFKLTDFQIINSLREKLILLSVGLVFSMSGILFIESFWSLYLPEVVSLIYSISLFICSLFLIALYVNLNIELLSIKNKFLISFYIAFARLFTCFLCILWLEPIFSIPLLLLLEIIFVSTRPKKLHTRWMLYLVISLIVFVKFFIFFEQLNILDLVATLPYGITIILYLSNLVPIFGFSILLNLKENNFYEKFCLYLTLSALVFVSLISFTTIFLLYEFTISLFLFFLLFGIDYYLRGDQKYKLFIKPSVIIFVFNVISWISYMFLFTRPDLLLYNFILTFSLTASITSLTFIILYNDIVDPLRKIFIVLACLSITVFIPTFMYVLFISYFQFYFADPIIILISLNIAFILSYISIAIYYWEISWRIWKVGWYLWLIIPVANFYFINKLVLGVDIYTNALNFFGVFNLTGSFIITLVLSTLFYIPVFYSKLKKYFYEIIIIIWGESLTLTYWISQNLFSDNLILSNLFFGFLSVLIIVPVLWKMKAWKIISLVWFLLAALNCSFLSYFLYVLNFLIELIISIDIIIISIFIIIFSRFPNIKGTNSRILLIFSYFLTLLGVFLLLFFILFNITLQPIISMNLAFIIISGALFTSKYIKINQILTRFAISLLFITNISSFVFFTFNILPNMTIISIFIAFTTFFGSLLLFNHFDMIIRKFNYAYFWIPFGLFLSLSFTFFLSFFIPSNIFLLLGICILINVVFLQRVLNRFISAIIFLYPISIAFLLLEAFTRVNFLQENLLLIWLQIYVLSFQIILNISNYLVKGRDEKKISFYQQFFENQRRIILLNIGSFSLNCLVFSFLISFLFFSVIYYQLIIFWMIFSILSLFNLYYVNYNSGLIDFKYTFLLLNFLGGAFYTIIPLLSAFYLILLFFSTLLEVINIVITFLLTVSCVLFLEILADKYLFNFLLLKEDSNYSHTKLLYALGYLIYLQFDLISLLFMINFIGILESILIFLIILIPLLVVDIYCFNLFGKWKSFLGLTILFFTCSVLGLLVLLIYSSPWTILMKLDIVLFISSLFITNYLYLNLRTAMLGEIKSERQIIDEQQVKLLKLYSMRKNLIGITFYVTFIIFLQDVVSLIIPVEEFFFHTLLISAIIFLISGLDNKVFKFLGKASQYFLSSSWFFLIITSNTFIFTLYISYIPDLILFAIPLLIFIISFQLLYLFKLLTFWTLIATYDQKIKQVLILIICFDIVSLPLYFLTLRFIMIDFNLILLSIIIFEVFLKIDEIYEFTSLSNENRSKLFYYTGFTFITMLSVDLFLFLALLIQPIIPLFSITVNVNISLLVLFSFYALFFNTFERHSKWAVFSWILIFITFSFFIFQITYYFRFFPIFFTLMSLSITLLLYPFIFLMENIRRLFRTMFDKVIGFFKRIYQNLVSLVSYIKQHLVLFKEFLLKIFRKYWIYFLTFICLNVSILITILLIFALQFVWFNSILIGGGSGLFILFFLYSYKRSIEDPNKALKFRMFYLSSIWTAILGIIFNFLDIRFYFLASFLSLVVLGAILLPYIYYLEKQKGISVKWRFYLTLIFILIVVITLILFYFQIITEIL